MLRILSIIAALALLLAFTAPIAAGQPSATSFTYQGQLQDDGVGVTAPSARMIFRLWDAASGGNQIGIDWGVSPVNVVEGLFTAELDFGSTAFDGAARWLEIGVDVSGGTNYTWLSPRHRITATPYALHALHSGDSLWDLSGSDISYTDGKVGIGTATPVSQLDVTGSGPTRIISGVSMDVSGSHSGVYGESISTTGYGVRGKASATSGTVSGVYGETGSPDGRAVHGYAGNPTGINNGVYGVTRSSDGFGVHGVNSASTGTGIGVFGETGSTTGYGGYFLGRAYFGGDVGFGVLEPTSKLDVAGTLTTTGFRLNSSPQTGYVLTSDTHGVGTWQAVPTGTIGGSGTQYFLARFTGATTLGSSIIYESSGGNIGIGTAAPSTKLHVVGTLRTDAFLLPTSPHVGYVLTADAGGMGTWQVPTGADSYWQPGTGSAIYYNAGNVGVGTSTPSQKLEVAGTARMTGFQLPTSAQAGYVLTGDAGGAGTWQAPTGGLTLPYTGTVSSTVPAFQVTNTGTGASSWAIKGTSSGDGAAYFYCDKVGGFGMKAVAANTFDCLTTRAGWFVCEGVSGRAIDAEATGSNANAVRASAPGEFGCAVSAIANGTEGVGLYASGGKLAARLYGNVAIYEFGTTTKVIELGKGLDYAEGFDVSPAKEEVTPGTVLVIDPRNPGRLTRCDQAYDRKVAGIVAGAKGLGSGVRLGSGQFDHNVALAGRVYCNVIALDGDIQPGDLLTTSSVPGYAMQVRDHSRAQGAVLGKAMEPLRKGERGQILVLVTLQ
jgi:hypothetical protein